jgi:hypothetical protein
MGALLKLAASVLFGYVSFISYSYELELLHQSSWFYLSAGLAIATLGSLFDGGNRSSEAG